MVECAVSCKTAGIFVPFIVSLGYKHGEVQTGPSDRDPYQERSIVLKHFSPTLALSTQNISKIALLLLWSVFWQCAFIITSFAPIRDRNTKAEVCGQGQKRKT